jgi:hypothetical protein
MTDLDPENKEMGDKIQRIVNKIGSTLSQVQALSPTQCYTLQVHFHRILKLELECMTSTLTLLEELDYMNSQDGYADDDDEENSTLDDETREIIDLTEHDVTDRFTATTTTKYVYFTPIKCETTLNVPSRPEKIHYPEVKKVRRNV